MNETRVAVCPCGHKVQTRELVPSGWALLDGVFRCRSCVVLASLFAPAQGERVRAA